MVSAPDDPFISSLWQCAVKGAENHRLVLDDQHADHDAAAGGERDAGRGRRLAGRRTSPASARGRRVARQRRSPAPVAGTASTPGRRRHRGDQGDAGSCDPNWGQPVSLPPTHRGRGRVARRAGQRPLGPPEQPGVSSAAAGGRKQAAAGHHRGDRRSPALESGSSARWAARVASSGRPRSSQASRPCHERRPSTRAKGDSPSGGLGALAESLNMPRSFQRGSVLRRAASGGGRLRRLRPGDRPPVDCGCSLSPSPVFGTHGCHDVGICPGL